MRTTGCRFATAPDVVGDAAATLLRSAPWLDRIRAAGFPAALVAQNGLESLSIPWDDFDVLFVGGDDEWKDGPHAACLIAEANERGKGTHVGRVNTWKRFHASHLAGADSVDGTMVRWGHVPRMVRWLDRVNASTLPLAFSATPTKGEA